ncbi:DUF4278 domain-containing protein [filamentous cyanobacterium LEGE 11480]|uniref:DUF4278 domain-containing protein n=1 Tax=Romeriopsis navalis LEGE 11480 TaxID=2777977 RepID=A0A928VQF0_9CYAN|nr:DUF4278 domain-containing protein [Romeriopsis navalis]MBE9030637.1 DUF4278 domain-containing protein [Romeriopsis navalis LEGE 11480]
MKLLYRGASYTINNQSAQSPSAVDSSRQADVRLTYRGSSYERQPESVLVAATAKANVSTATLMYRGQTYDRRVPVSSSEPTMPTADITLAIAS